ncbi:MAG: glutaminyl-peptide cyclotransferase [Deltaproteobacteria bacterium]|jgi:glutaminyl-peptide cyclotransferase|nr:glutaminyl-peptide cyclotransferase [Deltaproteobacteria bacterium]
MPPEPEDETKKKKRRGNANPPPEGTAGRAAASLRPTPVFGESGPPGPRALGPRAPGFSAILALLLASLLIPLGAADALSDPPRRVRAELVRAIPKPPKFTQGLFFHEGILYESSGLYGESELNLWKITETPAKAAGITRGAIVPQRVLDRREPVKTVKLPPKVFGEGSAFVPSPGGEGYVYVLTWTDRTLLRYSLPDLNPVMFPATYPGEGWGLTLKGSVLYRSDGSNMLWAHDPDTFELLPDKSFPVTETSKDPLIRNRTPVSLLNELESHPDRDLIFANVYLTDLVAVIEAGEENSGNVAFYLDFTELSRAVRNEHGIKDRGLCLNGLAFDGNGALYATGKNWPVLLEVTFDWPEVPGVETGAETGAGKGEEGD